MPLLKKYFNTVYFPGRENKTEEIEVKADKAGLHQIRDFVVRACVETGLTQQETHNLRLALDEAASNVLRHAYQGEPGPISLKITFFSRFLRLELVDKGKGFAWDQAPTPDLNRYVSERKKGGLGIWFIRRLTDASDYKSLPDGNHLILWKRVPRKKATASRLQSMLTQIRPRQSLRRVFMIRAGALLGVVIAVAFFYGAYRVNDALQQRFHENATSTALNMAAASLDYLYKKQDLLLSNLASDVMRHDPSLGYAVIVDKDGLILGHSDLRKLFTVYHAPLGVHRAGPLPQQVDWRGEDGSLYTDVSVAIMDHKKLFGEVHVGFKDEVIRAAVRRERAGWTLIGLLVLALGTGGSLLLIKIIIRPIQQLTEGVIAIGEGKLDHRIDVGTQDEFGQIADAFNVMTARFSDAQKNLVEQESVRKELQVAKDIQQTLLPRSLPVVEGYDVSSLYRAAKDVGGDYYDFMKVDRKRFGICVADVSGKGVPGSLVMTMIRTSIRLEARNNASPASVLDRVNSFVTGDMKRGMFVTLFYLVLDSHQRVIRYASAGHDPLILFRAATKKTYLLKPKGFPLGITLPDPTQFGRSLREEHVHLAKGDILVAYTDGIVEAMNAKRQQYGMGRFLHFIRENSAYGSRDFVQRLDGEIRDFTGDYPQNDDITLVAVKEGLSQAEMQHSLRQKMTELIEVQKLPIAEACRRLNLTPAAWYSYKKQRRRYGREAAMQGRQHYREELQLVSMEERERMYPLIGLHPEWGARELAKEMEQLSQGGIQLNAAVVEDDLQRLRLFTPEQRLKFSTKWQKGESISLPNSGIQAEDFKKLQPAPAASSGVGLAVPEATDAAPVGPAPAVVPDAPAPVAAPAAAPEGVKPDAITVAEVPMAEQVGEAASSVIMTHEAPAVPEPGVPAPTASFPPPLAIKPGKSRKGPARKKKARKPAQKKKKRA